MSSETVGAKPGVDWKRFAMQVAAITLGGFLALWLFAFSARYVVGAWIADSWSDSVSTVTESSTGSAGLTPEEYRECLRTHSTAYCDVQDGN